MKRLFYLALSVFIVSIISFSCNKDENPASNNNTGSNPVTIKWTSFKKSGLNIGIGPGITEDTINAVIPADCFPINYIKNVNLVLDSIIGVDASKLKFELVHQGYTVRVIDTLYYGGIGNSFIGTILSDSSTDPIRTAQSPFKGIFKPANPMSTFRDSPPEGEYLLRIINSDTVRTGVIKSWSLTVTYSPVMSNYCIEFNGTNQYATVPSTTSINSILSGTFTLEGWYKILGIGSPHYNYFSFLDKENCWYFEYSKNDTAWTFVEPGSTTAKARLPITLDTWYHIAMTYDAPNNTIKFYSNGQNFYTVNISYTFISNTNPLNIARGISGSVEYGYGRYDEIRIWNIVRSASEISANYNKSLTGSESGLVLYYKFSEGTGSTFNDASTNGNNGTLFNSPVWSQDGPSINP
jgi:hypothetical protein